MLINSNSKLCNYNTCAEIQIIWCPWGEQVRIYFMFHSAIPETMETTWLHPRLAPLPPRSQFLVLPLHQEDRNGADSWHPSLVPFYVELRETVDAKLFLARHETHRTFRSLHLISGLSGRRYTCRMGIDVTMAIEQLFPVLSKCISICDQAGVRKERNTSSRKKTEMGARQAAPYSAEVQSAFPHSHTLLPLESKSPLFFVSLDSS